MQRTTALQQHSPIRRETHSLKHYGYDDALSSNPNERAAFYRNSTLSQKDVENALTDLAWQVRRVIAERTDIALSNEQIERGLTDADEAVRYAFVGRNDFNLAEAQLLRGLNDQEAHVRRKFAEKQSRHSPKNI